jgi:hypothetical protein
MADAQTNEEPVVPVEIVEVHDMDAATWTEDPDEKRRAFVVNQMASPEIDGATMVKNMHAVCEWLKSGVLPDERLVVKGVRVV